MRMSSLAAALALGSAAAPACAQISLGGGVFSVPVTSMRDIPFRTVVRQQYDYSCGSAALATLLHHHYGIEVTEADVFKDMYARGDQTKIQKVGFSLLDMKLYLERRGMAADGFRATVAQLEAAKAPALAVISVGAYRHFVVIKGVSRGRVLVGDPALGLKTYSEAEFAKVWNGVVFAIHAAPGLQAAYNRAEEWSPWATAPLGRALSDGSLASFTRELPPLYQVVAPIQLTGNLR